jgi:hypothetical protein
MVLSMTISRVQKMMISTMTSELMASSVVATGPSTTASPALRTAMMISAPTASSVAATVRSTTASPALRAAMMISAPTA